MIKSLFIRGLPGVGKSVLIDRLAPYLDWPILDPDYWSQSSQSAYTTQERTAVYRQLLGQAIQHINQSYPFVWVQPWSSMAGLEHTIRVIAKQTFPEELRHLSHSDTSHIPLSELLRLGNFSPQIVEICPSLDILRTNLASRNARFTEAGIEGRVLSEEQIQDYLQGFEQYNLELPYLALDKKEQNGAETDYHIQAILNFIYPEG